MRYLLSYHDDKDGYGYAGLKVLQALERLVPGEWRGVDVLKYKWHPQARWSLDGEAVALCVPEWWPLVGARRLVGYTMFESTRMPATRVALINRCAEVCLVPCEWCAATFWAQGVRVPLRVVRWGVDQEDFYYLDRSDHDGPYTFLWSGTPDMRKGWDLVYRAFWAAFEGNEDVRLVLHFRELPRGLKGSNDPNVKVVEGLLDRPGLRAMLEAADCFVFPSRGEGWGLPPREAAATGLPVIATAWGGLAEEIEHWALPLCIAGTSPADFGEWGAGEIGEWVEPDFEHLVDLMRWCAYSRGTAARFGDEAAAWLASNTPWERTARGILEALG